MLRLNQLNYLIFFTLYALVDSEVDYFINRTILKVIESGTTYYNTRKTGLYIHYSMMNVMLYAYYPTRSAPTGYYDVYIKYRNYEKEEFTYKIGRINHKDVNAKIWVVDDKAKFYDINKSDKSLYSFEVYTKYIEESGTPFTIASNAEYFSKNWRFVIYFANNYEIFNGKLEDPNFYDNVTDDFCTQFVYTEGGPIRTIGAFCPYDYPENNYMDECLNWRRTDIIGKKCKQHISNELRIKSTKHYCNIHPFAPDCRCINRNLHNDFKQEEKDKTMTFDGDGLCWYKNCNNNNYLKENVTCPKCTVNLEIKSGNYKTDDIVNCFIKARNTNNIDIIKKCINPYLNKKTISCLKFNKIDLNVYIDSRTCNESYNNVCFISG